MDSNITDLAVGSVFLLFTGADLGIESNILEIISKFGVIAVLWFWLKDMRRQMKELREEHKEQVKTLNDMYEDYKNRIDKQLKNRQ
jgi:hypothetical protein